MGARTHNVVRHTARCLPNCRLISPHKRGLFDPDWIYPTNASPRQPIHSFNLRIQICTLMEEIGKNK